MVLGIGEGSIDIKTGKTSFAPGDAVNGELVLSLKEPRKARELRILFYGEISEHYYQHGKSHSRIKRIYEQKAVLGGEQKYPAGTKSYPFELRIPNIESAKGSGEGVLGSAMNLVAGLFDPLSGAKWYLDASLDVPASFDINKKIRISLTR